MRRYIDYLKDNPKGYWFKRKLYGWGWAPARWQGWLVLFLYVSAILKILLLWNFNSPDPWEITSQTLLPFSVVTIGMLFICYVTVQSPRWQWGVEKKD